MDLLPSAEQSEIIDTAAAFVRDRLSIATTRARFGQTPACDPAVWNEAAGLGWLALGLAEHHGGIGLGLVDEALLVKELGRGLAPGPFIATMLAARVAAQAGHGALAASIAGGQPVGLAIGPVTFDSATTVSGTLHLLDAHDALVLVVNADHAALVEVDRLADVADLPCTDPAVQLRSGLAESTPVVASVTRAVEAIELRGHVLAAAMLAGIIEAARDLAVAHAGVRVQFDRPIGVNQAIKHPCADMAVQAQLANAQMLFAALAIDEHRPDAELQALSAHVVAAEAARSATAAATQIHGGMGITFEHDCHLYVKRTLVLSQMFGGIRPQLPRLLALPEAS